MSDSLEGQRRIVKISIFKIKIIMNCNNKYLNCVGKYSNRELNNINDIVCNYKRNCRKGVIKELSFYAEGSLLEAIEKSAMCITSEGKRHNHQRRIPIESLRKTKNLLKLKCERLKKCQTFEQLYTIVQEIIDPIFKIGPLTIYDITHRIGIKLKLYPNLVYLHAGTAIGAKLLRLDCSSDTLEISKLPKQLQGLEPYEIEDCLCMYQKLKCKMTM